MTLIFPDPHFIKLLFPSLRKQPQETIPFLAESVRVISLTSEILRGKFEVL